MTYDNIMLDLETMGKRPSAPIIYVGAVAFNLEARSIGPVFDVPVYLPSAISHGAVLEADTVLWWLKQDQSARDKSLSATSQDTLHYALCQFSRFCTNLCDKQQLKVWGNGSDFDNVILKESYERDGMVAPWEFWNNKCYRSKKQEVPDLRIVREGIKHTAVDDAMSQVKHLFAIYDRLGQ